MADDPHTNIDTLDPFARIDPWTALQDGRRQLLLALEACGPRSGARMLAIPEFEALGGSAGSLATVLLAHAAHDRAHAAFFASLDPTDRVESVVATSAVDLADWGAVCAEVAAARMTMLEAAAGLGPEQWGRTLRPPWDQSAADTLLSLLILRAMADGILADAILALSALPPEGEPAR